MIPETTEIKIVIPQAYVGRVIEILMFSPDELAISAENLGDEASIEAELNYSTLPNKVASTKMPFAINNAEKIINEVNATESGDANSRYPFWNPLAADSGKIEDEVSFNSFIERDSDI